MKYQLVAITIVVSVGGCGKENNIERQLCSLDQHNCKGDLLQKCNTSLNGFDDLWHCKPGS